MTSSWANSWSLQHSLRTTKNPNLFLVSRQQDAPTPQCSERFLETAMSLIDTPSKFTSLWWRGRCMIGWDKRMLSQVQPPGARHRPTTSSPMYKEEKLSFSTPTSQRCESHVRVCVSASSSSFWKRGVPRYNINRSDYSKILCCACNRESIFVLSTSFNACF